MKAIIGILGEPCSGKTTLMRRLISELGGAERFERWTFGALAGMASWDSATVIFGVYDNQTVTGSAKLPPQAAIDAVNFFENCKKVPEAQGALVVLFEGEVFSEPETVKKFDTLGPLSLVSLVTNKNELQRREKVRNGARVQRINKTQPRANVSEYEKSLKISYFPNNTSGDQDAIVESIISLIERQALDS